MWILLARNLLNEDNIFNELIKRVQSNLVLAHSEIAPYAHICICGKFGLGEFWKAQKGPRENAFKTEYWVKDYQDWNLSFQRGSHQELNLEFEDGRLSYKKELTRTEFLVPIDSFHGLHF